MILYDQILMNVFKIFFKNMFTFPRRCIIIILDNKFYQTLGKELSEYKAFKCLDFSSSKALKLELNT